MRCLILASRSPRREQLLRGAGLRFRVIAPRVDEQAQAGETPGNMAERLAAAKAGEVATRAEDNACVLAADTVVVLGNRVLGKPRDEQEAVGMLRSLAGRRHRVITGFALWIVGAGLQETRAVESLVHMRVVGAEEAQAYAAGGEPLDKAGGYAAQGEGSRFVQLIEGSRSNVIGLPLEHVLPCLAACGVRPS